MGWPLRLVDSPFSNAAVFKFKEGKDGLLPVVGDCYFAPELLTLEKVPPWMHLSPCYKRDWLGKRDPIVVVLPDRNHFCVDAMAWKGGVPYGEGWTVVGTAPNISVMPSINFPGSYHGWIMNGVITDDCEGRKF